MCADRRSRFGLGRVSQSLLLLADGTQCDGMTEVKNRYPSKTGVPGVPGVPLKLKATDYVVFRLEHLFILAGTPGVPTEKGVPR